MAYLNGMEVARRNLGDGAIGWDGGAADHADYDAVVFEDVDISAYRDLLVSGENILALRVVNLSAESSDLLLSVEVAVPFSEPVFACGASSGCF